MRTTFNMIQQLFLVLPQNLVGLLKQRRAHDKSLLGSNQFPGHIAILGMEAIIQGRTLQAPFKLHTAMFHGLSISADFNIWRSSGTIVFNTSE